MPLQARAAAFAARIGVTGLIIAGLAIALVLSLVNTYADLRIPIPLLPDIHYEGWKPKAQRLQGVIDQFDKAQDDALKAAELAKAKAEADYRNLAERIDDEAEEARAGALDDAERFIAANRVRAPDRCAARGTGSPGGDRSAGNGETVREAPELDGTVAVLADDVRVCTANTLQAEAARAWALGLEAASRPD